MPEELYNSHDYCLLVDEFEALKDELAEVTAERDEWKHDAERLAGRYMATYRTCVHCEERLDDVGEVGHSPNCPITLHRELVAKYEGENNETVNK